ncbi:MAG TPA: cyclic nucleotide-binding domain-containing protein, partial [Anaerolinea sp.]|nr:cyclic nucleotide-binding domain-containing protein [Anaerolinea sp.]
LSRLHLFAGIDEERLQFVAERLVQVPLRELELVYEQGQDSGSLYFIYDGRVQSTRYARGSTEEQMLGFLDEGDLFGHEALEAHELRQTTVQTVTNVILLRLDSSMLVEVSEQVPELVQRLALVLDSFHLMLRTHLGWANPEEYIHYLARRHPIFLWLRLVPLILILTLVAGILIGFYGMAPLTIFLMLLAGAVLIAAGVGVWLYVDWSNDYFIVTSKRVVYQERIVLLYDSRQESPIEQVQSTEMDRSYFGQLIGYGDVRIRTFTGLILFQSVRMPREVETIIQEQIKRTQSSLRREEIRAIEETIARRIGMLPMKPAPPQSTAQKAAQPSQFQHFLADLFHLRYEFGDTIQYRTHWWILATRIWFQSFLILLNVAALIYLIFETARGRLGPGFPVVAAFMGLCVLGLIIFLWWLYNYLDWH